MKLYKKICLALLTLTLAIGLAYSIPSIRYVVTDAGNHTSHSSGGSSSSHSSSSHSSSSHSSSSHSSSSSGSGGTTIDFDDFNNESVYWFYLETAVHSLCFFEVPLAIIIYRLFKKKIKFIFILIPTLLTILGIFTYINFAISPSVAAMIRFASIFVGGFPCFAICLISSGISDNSSTINNKKYLPLSKEILEKNNINSIEELSNEVYKIFEGVEIAWMNFDNTKLKEYCTDELYNTYRAQLDAYEIKHEQNIMEDIKRIKVIPYDFYITNQNVTLKVMIQIEMKDYIINTVDNKVTQGSKNQIYNNTYEITYVKNIVNKLDKCPNCGADVSKNTGTVKCPYCNTVIVNADDKWHISDKVLTIQKNK